MSDDRTTPTTDFSLEISAPVATFILPNTGRLVLITRPAWWHLLVAYVLGAIVGGLAMKAVI